MTKKDPSAHAPLPVQGAVSFPAAGPGFYIKIDNAFFEDMEARHGEERWFWEGLSEVNSILPSKLTANLRRFCKSPEHKPFAKTMSAVDSSPNEIVMALRDAMFMAVHRMTASEFEERQEELARRLADRPLGDPEEASSETSTEKPSEQDAPQASSGD